MATTKRDMVRGHKVLKGRLIFAVLFSLFGIIGIVAVFKIISIRAGYAEPENEYADLRIYAPVISTASETQTEQQSSIDTNYDLSSYDLSSYNLSSINPDYIGWIRIDGADIDYPIVQGQDNAKYLSTSFSGENNKAGAIFMDYRCEDGFNGSFPLIHGHNMKDGSMFAALHLFLDDAFLSQHSEIIIVTSEGEALRYRILSVYVTDTNDRAFTLLESDEITIERYCLELGVQEGEKILALSTCTNNNSDSERLLLFAAME